MILQALERGIARGFVLLSIPFLAATAHAADESLKVLSYNVAGLQPIVQFFKGEPELDPTVHIPLIAPHFDANDYDVVVFQEGFVHGTDDPSDDPPPLYEEDSLGVGTYFYETLTANSGAPPFAQIAPIDSLSAEAEASSGLGRLSTHPFTDFLRNKWDDLVSTDALSDKGYSFARHEVEDGVFVDVYNWHSHANAGGDGIPARAKNIEELIVAINASSSGKAVIVIGDTNSLYPRTSDTIRRLLGLEDGPEGSQNLDVPLKDVWIELARNGSVPAQDGNLLKECAGEHLQAGANCEHKDKVLYRSGTDVQLAAGEYFVEMDFVKPGTAPPLQLSDHWPVGAEFNVTVPEPQAASAVALLALAALAHFRRARRG